MRHVTSQAAALLEVLALMNPDSSKNTLRSWIEQGRVSVDGRVVKKTGAVVQEGIEVCVGKRIKFIENEIEILYEDRHLVVINKPEGLLSVCTDYDKASSAHAILKRRYYSQRVYPVHRLDRETSGVMLFAYSDEAREDLKKKFYIHDVEREYHAVIEGHATPAQGVWQSYLVEDERYVVRSAKEGEGRLGITHYAMVSQSSRFALLRLKLETGRKNQIRVHCKDAGHPIVGDSKYGSVTGGRMCLHASKLGFKHPVSKKQLSFESKLPQCFFAFLKKNPVTS